MVLVGGCVDGAWPVVLMERSKGFVGFKWASSPVLVGVSAR